MSIPQRLTARIGPLRLLCLLGATGCAIAAGPTGSGGTARGSSAALAGAAGTLNDTPGTAPGSQAGALAGSQAGSQPDSTAFPSAETQGAAPDAQGDSQAKPPNTENAQGESPSATASSSASASLAPATPSTAPAPFDAGAVVAAPAAPASAGRGPSLSAADLAPRVMVTLAPAPLPIWNQITLDLQRTYRMRIVWAWSMQSLGERCIVFEAPRGRPVEALIRRLAADPRVEIVQPLQQFVSQETRTGSRPVPLQHSAQALRLLQAHHWATGRGVRIAVIDTGIDVDHPELRGQIAKLRNFTESADRSFNSDIHGTAVAGVIVAALNAEIGLVGVAPQAQVYALKACWQERPGAREAVCDSYTLAKAVDFAISQGVQVLNFSLAGPPDPLLAKLVATALARGIVVVAADGPDPSRSFPASQRGVLAVAGSDDLQGGLRFPTRRLAAGTLCAPGVDILTTVPNGHYDFFSGSSFAAAQVSGVVALLLEREPRLSPVQVAALFHRTAHPIPAAPGDAAGSFDQVDACAALTASLGGGAGGCS